MKSCLILLLFVMMIIPIFSVTVNAETLYIDASVGKMKDIRESKYLASAITIVRNSDGGLISVVKADATRYLDDSIIDRYLNYNSENLVKSGIVDGEIVKMYQIKIEYDNPKCAEETFLVPGFIDECNWKNRAFVSMLGVNDEKNETHEIFRGLNHAFTVKSLDQVTSFWTILVKD